MKRLLRPEHPHDLRQRRVWSLLTLGYLAVAYYLTGWAFPRLFRSLPELNFYVAQPILWTGLGVASYYGWRHLPNRPGFHWSLVRAGMMIGIFHVSVLVIAGVFAGFGRSGVGIKLINYPLNILYLGSMLAGLETARAYLLAVWRENSERAAFVAVSLVIFAAATPVGRWFALDDVDRVFRIGGGLLVPALVVSGVATWIAGRSGPGPAIAYQSLLLALEGLSPIIPDLSWLPLLLLGTGVPLVALGLFRGLGEGVLPSEEDDVDESRIERRWPAWVVTVGISALLVGFFFGTFGVRPFAVSGISMEPALEAGDLVIIREGIDPEELQTGDIVKYERGSLPVIHRINSIERSAGDVLVTTKGDNVSSPDPPVDGTEIEGKAVFVIPWIGKIVLWFGG